MSSGYLALVLHAHLPFVRHPEHEDFLEEDWLFEALTESYLPLIAMMERHLEETRAFASRAPEPVQHYLSRENIAILEQEIEAFKSRLAQWTTAGARRE